MIRAIVKSAVFYGPLLVELILKRIATRRMVANLKWLGFILRWLVAISLVALLSLVILWAFFPSTSPDWTGFNTYVNDQRLLVTADGTVIKTKTLWDWLGLIIVGLVIAVGGILLNRSARANELRIAEDDRNQVALQAYYDKMADLILIHHLKDDEKGKEGRSIVRARTLAILPILDPKRKASLLIFLHESGLIGYENPIVVLSTADLTKANLRGVSLNTTSLTKINLKQADLEQADLFEVDLFEANLRGANLRNATLSKVNLSRANLSQGDLLGISLVEADLSRANLHSANLHSANLGKANLKWADLSEANLNGARLQSATLTRANLTMALLPGANLNMATLSRANLNRAYLLNARLGSADLSGADLREASLLLADLSGANLSGANLRSADLRGAKLPKADLNGATLSKATYDARTVWPDDFDPRSE